MNRRRWMIGICMIVLVVMVFLASSLHDVHFKPGISVMSDIQSASPSSLPMIQTIQEIPIWKLLLFWLAFVINLVLFIWLVPPEVRKRIIRQAISFAVGLLVLLFALRYRVIQLPFFQSSPSDLSGQPLPASSSSLPAPEFHPPRMTPWMIYLISLGVLLVLLLLVWVASRWWAHFHGPPNSSLHAIADVARSSLDALASGRDWGDAIVLSYVRMSEVISVRRGLQRAQAMTPREFAWKLEHAGLPADAVGRLTGLFESVRYGNRKSTQSEVNEAVDCLNSILQACGTSA